MFEKKREPSLKKNLSSNSVFFLRTTNKIYASIRMASSPRPIVSNGDVFQINFPAIPRLAGIGDLVRFNRASIPSLPKLSPLVAPPPRNHFQISRSSFTSDPSFYSVFDIASSPVENRKFGIRKWKMLGSIGDFSMEMCIYIVSLFLYA